MIEVVIEPTFSAWRQAARGLLMEGVEPRDVEWREVEDAQASLGLAMEAEASAESRPLAGFRVSRRFVELAEAAACHGDGERWGLLYRLLWRQTHGEPRLMEVASDPDVHRLLRMEKAVRREVHKMHAFVRFRAVEHEGGTHYVAWFEPEHHVVERGSPFFADRFASMRWSILTPRRCAHWDGERLAFTPGVPRSHAPDEDRLEALWRTYLRRHLQPRPPAPRRHARRDAQALLEEPPRSRPDRPADERSARPRAPDAGAEWTDGVMPNPEKTLARRATERQSSRDESSASLPLCCSA